MAKVNKFGKHFYITLFILAPLIFTSSFAQDVYVLTIPHLLKYFNTTPKVIQLTISTFILFTGLGQLVYGPWSDQIGRRKVVLIASVVFAIGSLICALAPTIAILILGRATEGAGACGMTVCALAIVRDLYEGDKLTKMYSLLNSLIALSPLLAPMIGGYLDVHFSWRACFLFLVALAIMALLITYCKIPETLQKQNRTKFDSSVFKTYWSILKNKQFQTFAFAGAAGLACFFTFFSMSSYLLITLLKVPEEHFGYYFAIIGVVFFSGSVLSGYLAGWVGTYRTVIIGAVAMVISGAVMLVWYCLYGLSIFGFMIPMALMGLGGAIVMGGGAGGAIAPFGETAGAASALFGSGQFVFSFVISSIVMLKPVKSTEPLAYTILILSIIVCLLCFINRNYISVQTVK